MTGLRDDKEEMFNSIRSITGIDKKIIKAVFDGLYIAQLQKIATRGKSIYIPNLGEIIINKSPTDEIFYTFKPLDEADYAIRQARDGRIMSFKEMLTSIIETQIIDDTDNILDMLLTNEELMDLGILD